MSALGEWKYSTIQSQSWHFVDMSGHIKVSTVLNSVPTDEDIFFGPKAGLDAPDKKK
jgi:hypothetical protein